MPRPESYSLPRNCGNCNFAHLLSQLVPYIKYDILVCLYNNSIPNFQECADTNRIGEFAKWIHESQVNHIGFCKFHQMVPTICACCNTVEKI